MRTPHETTARSPNLCCYCFYRMLYYAVASLRTFVDRKTGADRGRSSFGVKRAEEQTTVERGCYVGRRINETIA